TVTSSDVTHSLLPTLTPPPSSGLFPYTTLFRSTGGDGFAALNHTDSSITVSASVTDDAGNTASPTNKNFSLDTTADGDATALSLTAANPAGGTKEAAVFIPLLGDQNQLAPGPVK